MPNVSSVKSKIEEACQSSTRRMSSDPTVAETDRVGPPRLDRLQRLRHRFYEPLILLWILNPATGGHGTQPTLAHSSSIRLTERQVFLDSLAWFCDSKHGGQTVSAVAAVSCPEGCKYLVCSSHERARTHLCWILHSITMSIIDEGRRQRDQRIRSIVERAITFSADKVRQYRRRLHRYLSSISHAFEPDVLEAITLITDQRNSPIEICDAAVAFQHQGALEALHDFNGHARTLREPSAFTLVSHCITRLQEWHRKSAAVVDFGKR